MGRPLRLLTEDGTYFVTARTIQSRFLLRPSQNINELVGGVLARAADKYAVDVHAFVFASNHFHLIVHAPGDSLPRFMQYFLGNVAKKVGRLLDWTGHFWQRRYSSEPILDDEALLGRLRYVLAHGVKEGLVARCEDWPGLSCLPQLLGAAARLFRWFNWTRRASQRHRLGVMEARLAPEWAEEVTLRLTPIPSWAALSNEARRQKVVSLIGEIEEAARTERGDASPLGHEQVLAQSPFDAPRETKRKPRPLCHASSAEARSAFKEAYGLFVALFREASKRWRAGEPDPGFPPRSFRPGFVLGTPADATTFNAAGQYPRLYGSLSASSALMER